ncbi:hypothetical protein OC834_007342 [Tilletia horrida]|nr:hypothetical protein OC834_007342 [Tilletia horrida]
MQPKLTFKSEQRAAVEALYRPDHKALAQLHYTEPVLTYRSIRTSVDYTDKIVQSNFASNGNAADINAVVYTTSFLDGSHTFCLRVGDEVKFSEICGANVGDALDRCQVHTGTIARLVIATSHNEEAPAAVFARLNDVTPRGSKLILEHQIHPVGRLRPSSTGRFAPDAAAEANFWRNIRPTVICADIAYPVADLPQQLLSARGVSKYIPKHGRLIAAEDEDGMVQLDASMEDKSLVSATVLNSCGFDAEDEPERVTFRVGDHVVGICPRVKAGHKFVQHRDSF